MTRAPSVDADDSDRPRPHGSVNDIVLNRAGCLGICGGWEVTAQSTSRQHDFGPQLAVAIEGDLAAEVVATFDHRFEQLLDE